MSLHKTLLIIFVLTLSATPVYARSYDAPDRLLKKSLEALQARMKAVSEKNRRLEERNRDLRSRVMDLSRNLRRTQEEKIRNTEEMIGIESGLPEEFSEEDRAYLEGQKEILERQNRELTGRIDHLHEEVASREEEAGDLREDMALVKEEAESVRPVPAWLKKKESLETALTVQRSRLDNLLNEIERTEAEAERRRVTHQAGQNRHDVLQQRRARLYEELSRQEERTVFLNKQQEQLSRRRNDAVESVNKEISQYEDIRERLSQILTDLQL